MDAFAAGRLTRSLDSLHAAVYFVPEANDKFGELGLDFTTHYFASRSAPMGAVSANVVAATFYNFSPQLVASTIPRAWELASPTTVTRVRYEIVETALPRVLGEELSRSAELARAAALLRRVAEAIPNADGRPLYAGHAELPWPDTPVVALW
ncbi:MAG: SCO6745 family protein, partial [Mycobacterium sp.]